MKGIEMYKRMLYLFLLFVVLGIHEASSQKKDIKKQDNYGSLFITCKPGYKIYLDDNLVGITNKDEGGLFIKNIPIGEHQIKVKKSNTQDQVVKVFININKTSEIDLGYLTKNAENEELRLKIKNLIRNDGFYVMKTGNVDKNLLTANNEEYALLFFPEDPINNNNQVYLDMIWIEEDIDLEGKVRKSWVEAKSYNCFIENDGGQLKVYAESDKTVFYNDMSVVAYYYILDGILSEDGLSIYNVTLKRFKKNSDQFDNSKPWSLIDTIYGNLRFKRF